METEKRGTPVWFLVVIFIDKIVQVFFWLLNNMKVFVTYLCFCSILNNVSKKLTCVF